VLRLEPVNGPEMTAPLVAASRFATAGRAADCQVCLLHETVSRRHATFSERHGHWFVSDLGSRHGTYVNGVKLEPNAPAGLEPDDLLRIGPWTFRIGIGHDRTRSSATIAPSGMTTERIERVPERELAWAAQQRLNLLIECSAAINAAATEESLVRAALDAALAGSGYRRVAWLRAGQTGDGVEIVGFKSVVPERPDGFAFSQSLIREAARGNLARLTEDAPLDYGQSIASLGIHSALCAPLMLGGTVAGYLYFDARGQESPVHPEAAGFCQAIARMCGLALANLKRADLEQRQRRNEADLTTAREAQQLIMPPARGEVGAVSYALRVRPGRTVAGDLFDVVTLSEGKVGICIGDVTGESIGAGVLMVGTQAYLHGALARLQDPAAALMEVNRYLTSRSAMNMFVTMWLGVIDAAAGSVCYVDAGHGHWLIKRAGGKAPEAPPRPGGIPVAIDSSYHYENERMAISPGDRLILYSDGLLEQCSPTGEQFGLQRVIAAVSGTGRAVEADADALFDAVRRFACTDMLDDDATVAAVEVRKPA
jgi:serine phosphatase RsbU (regulator of sigma subunit)